MNKNRPLCTFIWRNIQVFSAIVVLWTWKFFKPSLREGCYRCDFKWVGITWSIYEIVHYVNRNRPLFYRRKFMSCIVFTTIFVLISHLWSLHSMRSPKSRYAMSSGNTPLCAGRDIQLKQPGELHVVDSPKTHSQMKHKNRIKFRKKY